jgi:phosphoribosylformylglycinamidine synthase subunit PurS
MARVVVDVMLKPEILDPQGQAVHRALPRLGFDGVLDVRQGKRFEIEFDGPADEAALAKAREVAEKLLANTVIEDFTVAFDTTPANTVGAAGTASTPLTAIHGSATDTAAGGSVSSGSANSGSAAGDSASSAASERTAD